MTDAEGRDALRVLVLLWHAPHEVIAAGGFRRTYEILNRAPEGILVEALDDCPTFLDGMDRDNVHVVEYRIPTAVRRLETRYFWLERAIEWTLTTVILTLSCALMRLRGEKYDVVFVPSSEQIPALLAGIAARTLFGANLVACNLNIDIFPARLRKSLARLHNAADQVIAISEHLASQLRSYGVRAPIVINGVGLDTGAISRLPDPEPSDKPFDAVFVGRHDPEKGIFDLIEIWNAVASRLPDARLVMIGSCNPNNRTRLESLIAKYGLGHNITMMGTVPDEEKYGLIKRSKVCVFPSFVEEWGLVPQEALACGLPAVVYDLPVYAENIAGCEAVLRMPIGDTGAVADAVVGLLEDDDYVSCGATGPEYVERFGWDEVAEREFAILLDSWKSHADSAHPSRADD
jgi:glycosyltransferase involved in cell wall biosynthesis